MGGNATTSWWVESRTVRARFDSNNLRWRSDPGKSRLHSKSALLSARTRASRDHATLEAQVTLTDLTAPFADKVELNGDHDPVPPARTRISLYLPTSTVRRLRGLVAATQGTEDELSLNEFMDEAAREKAERWERAKNGGEQYPPADEVRGARGGRRS